MYVDMWGLCVHVPIQASGESVCPGRSVYRACWERSAEEGRRGVWEKSKHGQSVLCVRIHTCSLWN